MAGRTAGLFPPQKVSGYVVRTRSSDSPFFFLAVKGTARLITSLLRCNSGGIADREKMWIWGQKDALFLILGGHVILSLILVIYFVSIILYILYIVYFLYNTYIIYIKSTSRAMQIVLLLFMPIKYCVLNTCLSYRNPTPLGVWAIP